MKLLRNKIALLITLLGLCGLTAFFVMSKENSEAQFPWETNNFKPFTQWYQINWYQQSVGYASTSLKLSNDEKHWIVVEDEYFEGRVQERFVSFHYTTELTFDRKPPYQLQSGNISSNEPELATSKSFSQNSESLLVNIRRNQQEKNYELTPLIFTLGDYFSLENKVLGLIKTNQSTSKTVRANALDQDIFEPLQHSWNLKKKKYLNTYQWKAENHSKRYNPFQTVVFNDDGSIHNKSRTNGMVFIPSAGKISLNTAMQPDLYQFNGIQLTNSYLLKDIPTIKKLSLETDKFHELVSADTEIPPNVHIDNKRLVITPYEPYLASKESIEEAVENKGNPRNRKLLSELLVDIQDKDDFTKSKLLLKRTHEYLQYQTSPAGFNLEEILTEKRGDCTEYSQLYSALLTEAGVKNRIRSGYVYLGGEQRSFGGHVWVEALIDGKWHGFDPTWNLEQLTILHLPISLKNPSNSLQPAEFTIKSIND